MNKRSSLVSTRLSCPVKGCPVVVFEVARELYDDDEAEIVTEYETNNGFSCADESDPDCQCRCCGI